jgi:hypothetical protein
MRRHLTGSTQSQVLEVIRECGDIRIKNIQQILGLPNENGYARVARAINDLMKAGYIKRPTYGRYRYVGVPQDIDYAKAQKRMARVIRIRTRRSEPFTARSLAELSDCSPGWSGRYINFLIRKGFLEKAGDETSPNKIKATTYLALEEKLNIEWPVMKRNVKAQNLDRLVSRIRAGAFQIGRSCEANKSSLTATREALKGITDMVDECLTTYN